MQSKNITLRALSIVAITAVAGLLTVGCSAEDEIQGAANREEASLLQPELDALVAAGVPVPCSSSTILKPRQSSSPPESRTSRADGRCGYAIASGSAA